MRKLLLFILFLVMFSVAVSAQVCDTGETRETICGAGACAGNTGIEYCVEGHWEGDTCDPFLGAGPELCDGIDNDCDASIIDDGEDESWLGDPAICGVGVCEASGTWTCEGGQQTSDCTPLQPTGADDDCDGIDQDCSGYADDNYVPEVTSCGVGGCFATGETICIDGILGDTCLPGEPADELCDGIDNDCDASIIDDGEDEVWYGDTTSCGQGVCAASGVLTCDGGSQVDTCVEGSTTGPDNNCDGIDDNCNGVADENYIYVPTTCGVGQCSSTGALICNGGSLQNTCTPSTPVPEFCDGLDNDCDGTIADDGEGESWFGDPTSCGQGACAGSGTYICDGGYQVDTCMVGSSTGDDTDCDGVDDNCNGENDENYVITPTTCGAGICTSAGQMVCIDGSESDTCAPGDPETEICDGLDNDCDSAVDEDLVPESCALQLGVCAGSTKVCGGFSGWLDCTASEYGAGYEASETSCDALDNDCDGVVDMMTSPTTCGVGVCTGNTGYETCTAGIWGDDTCDPLERASDEVCDALDNDCDGPVDEDLYRDTSCGVGACEGNTGYETCTIGTWGDDTCDPYYGASDEVCDYFDNDCDGEEDEVCPICEDGVCTHGETVDTCLQDCYVAPSFTPEPVRGDIEIIAYRYGQVDSVWFGVWRTYTDGYDPGVDEPYTGGPMYFEEGLSKYEVDMKKAPRTLFEQKTFTLKYEDAPYTQFMLTWNPGELSSYWRYRVDCGTGRVWDMRNKNWFILNTGADGEHTCTITASIT